MGFVTLQDILSAAPEVIICETEEYYYLVREVTEGFSIHREVYSRYKASLVGHKAKAFWVGSNPPPTDQVRYMWSGHWVEPAKEVGVCKSY